MREVPCGAGLLRSRTLLNAALWAVLLVCAWLLYPNQAVGHTETGPHAHGFMTFKVVRQRCCGRCCGDSARLRSRRGAVTVARGSAGRGTGRGCWPSFQCHLEVTGPTSVRQHDIEGHREYIDHLTAERRLPAIRQGWETWQPPLYYVAAALWRWPFSTISFQDPFRSVQFFAAALYLAAIIAAQVGLRRLGFNNVEATGALGLLALLPGIVVFAARINNDVLPADFGVGLLFATAEFVRTCRRATLVVLAGGGVAGVTGHEGIVIGHCRRGTGIGDVGSGAPLGVADGAMAGALDGLTSSGLAGVLVGPHGGTNRQSVLCLNADLAR